MLEEPEDSFVRPTWPDTCPASSPSTDLPTTSQGGQTLTKPAPKLCRVIPFPSIGHEGCSGVEVNRAAILITAGQSRSRLRSLSLTTIPSQSLDTTDGSWEGRPCGSYPQGSVSTSDHSLPAHSYGHNLHHLVRLWLPSQYGEGGR